MAMHHFWLTLGRQESFKAISQMYIHHCSQLKLKKPQDSQVYVDNLIRLRIVELGLDFSSEKQGIDAFVTGMYMNASSGAGNTSVAVPARDEFLRMTAFGQSFVTACISEYSTHSESGSVTESPANQSHP
jgi:hypothetical protein